ncbi:MAG: hypothetical protein IJ350_05935 [Clostridia bacterium]|nr:hypothetical protein [Clostridia bacterium]
MAKKKSSRYSPQAGALRKKEEARKLAERQAKYQQNKKKIWTAVIAAAVALVLIIIAVDFFYTPNGSMRVFFGQLMGAKDNALIGQMDNDLYYTFGYMDTPEGYTPEEFILYSNSSPTAEQDFYYVAEDESKAINNIYVTSVEGTTAPAMLETILGYTTYDTMTEAKTATVGGHEVHYIYAQDTSESEATMGQCFSLLIMYVDTIQESCILVNTTSPYVASMEEVPTEETLLAEAEAILAKLSLPQ